MEQNRWTSEDIPLMDGKIAVVTGANSGLGYYTSRALAAKQATVIMACRDLMKGETAKKKIEGEIQDANLFVFELDLASVDSIKKFSDDFNSHFMKLDLLINNAGLMAIPYNRTAEGFEMQFGVNHLGHFALTGLLLDLLLKTPGSRIINLSSAAHKFGKIRFNDINWEKGYRKWQAYGMSKLANLLFTQELVRRLNGQTDRLTVAAAHPGYADTELQAKGSEMKGAHMEASFYRFANRIAAQSGEMGALPILYAATSGNVVQGGFYGPGGLMHMKGYPVLDQPRKSLMDQKVAEKLWDISEEMTGIKYQFS